MSKGQRVLVTGHPGQLASALGVLSKSESGWSFKLNVHMLSLVSLILISLMQSIVSSG